MPQVDFNGRSIRIQGKDLFSISQMCEQIIEETKKQVANQILPPDQMDEFQIGTLALNVWRMRKRLITEKFEPADSTVHYEFAKSICPKFNYQLDEFLNVLAATRKRVRFAMGLGPLQVAHLISQQNEFRLCSPELSSSSIVTSIAGTAWQLQLSAGEKNILLPIDAIRGMLECRKVAVSGAVMRLCDAKIIDMVDAKFHTRKAREFRFIAVQGRDFDLKEKI